MSDRDKQPPGSLVIDDPIHARGYVILHKYILHASNLGAHAKILYCFLLSYAFQAEQCFPGYERLGADLDWSENVIRKYMRELEQVGLVRVERRGFKQTNLYHIARVDSVRLSTSESAAHQTQNLRLSPSDSEAEEESGSKNQGIVPMAQNAEPARPDPTAGMSDLERRLYWSRRARP